MRAPRTRLGSFTCTPWVAALALVAGCAPPPPEGVSQELWDLCRDDRGNRYADDERAAQLGRAIFFDEGFATVPGVS
jgi:hypothetical protein